MAFEFMETFDVFIPNVEEQLSNFSEADFSTKHGLIVEIAAIHEGTTGNYTTYSARELEKAVNSWLMPYPKPIILHHNLHSEPIGRVVGARMDTEEDGISYIRLQAAITDSVAIEKIKDKRYLTGSIGGRAEEAICSICKTDWAAPSRSSAPCAHRRGKSYKGQIATIELRDLEFKEYSFVNAPADSRSVVKSIQSSDFSESWNKPVRFFVLDLSEEDIVEYTESETIDVLGEMKRKDASPKYREMKGAFLEAQIINKIEEDGVKRHLNDTKDTEGIVESNSEETVMANEDTTETEDNDILAVTEQLSEDLSVSEEANDEETPQESDESADAAEAEEAEESEDAEESEEVEEAERPQGQEKARGKDVDAETSEGAPVSRESDEESDESAEAAEQQSDDSDEVTDVNEDEDSEEELNTPDKEESVEEATAEVESEESELAERVRTLEDENARLKKALHRTLAERVVDAKISVGMVAAESRNDEVEAHATRSASSLADSLRDLASMPRVNTSEALSNLEIDRETQNVEDESNVTTIGEEEGSVVEEVDPKKRLEEELTNALMGRRTNQL